MRQPRRLTVILSAFALLLGAASAWAARLPVLPRPLTAFHYPFAGVAFASATVDVVPVTLNRSGNGDHVTVHVRLPDTYRASEVDAARVRLCRGPNACAGGVLAEKPQSINGDRTLKCTFDRAAVIALVGDVARDTIVAFTVSGLIRSPPAYFAGSDTMRVL